MDNLNITLKSVIDLLAEDFFIPSYQRGYRWTAVQVTDLLNDLWEFQERSDQMSVEQFYCLQPMVVKKRNDNSYEVVDGQQRLTTLYLILTALKLYVEDQEESLFTLKFETRSETSGKFLENLDESLRHDNIDFHHIYNAYETITQWFKNKKGSKVVMAQTLLRGNDAGRNVKVIWYELPESENVIDAFTRLNIGKIPLTNSELIRALFLRSENFPKEAKDIHQLRIAQEWDRIENTLQQADFWHFIFNQSTPPANRIEFLFDHLVDESFPDETRSGDSYHAFHCYNGLLKKEEGVDTTLKSEREWKRVKQFFMTLEEWFKDRNLYHLTGLLIHLDVSITELINEAKQLPKPDFDQFLRKRIFRELFHSDPVADEGETLESLIAQKLSEMSYHSSKPQLRSVLLLFNIATLFENENSNIRFPFDSFKQEKWDIEHVSSVDSSKPQRPEHQRSWLQGVLNHYAEATQDSDLKQRLINTVQSSPFDGIGFDALYSEVTALSGEKDSSDADDQLENLTLLDQSTNRSYKNAIFPVKRDRILSLDRSGTFVPLCTRNIFLKCYSSKLDDMLRWNAEDKKDYKSHTLKTLTRFFSPTNQG